MKNVPDSLTELFEVLGREDPDKDKSLSAYTDIIDRWAAKLGESSEAWRGAMVTVGLIMPLLEAAYLETGAGADGLPPTYEAADALLRKVGMGTLLIMGTVGQHPLILQALQQDKENT